MESKFLWILQKQFTRYDNWPIKDLELPIVGFEALSVVSLSFLAAGKNTLLVKALVLFRPHSFKLISGKGLELVLQLRLG